MVKTALVRGVLPVLLAGAVFCNAAAAPSATSVPQLLASLASGPIDVRREAARALGLLRAKEAVPALLHAMGDNDRQVCSNAVAALGLIGPGAVEAVPKLIAELDSRTTSGTRDRDKRQSRLECAYALALIGAGAVPALVEALHSSDMPQRAGAIRALGEMFAARPPQAWVGSPGAAEISAAVPALIVCLGDADGEVAAEAVECLERIGGPARSPLRSALSSAEPRLRKNAVLVLGRLGAVECAPELLQMLKSETDGPVRIALYAVLAKISPGPVLPLLLDGLKSADATVRTGAMNGILLLRTGPKPALPALISYLSAASPSLRHSAVEVLGLIGPRANPAVPALIAAMNRGEDCTLALARIGAVREVLQAADSLPTLDAGHWSVRCFKAVGGSATPALGAALVSAGNGGRLAAVYGLSAIGRPAVAATPALLKACLDPEPQVRAAALRALFDVGASRDVLLPAIETASADASPQVRTAAGALKPLVERRKE